MNLPQPDEAALVVNVEGAGAEILLPGCRNDECISHGHLLHDCADPLARKPEGGLFGAASWTT